MQKQNRKNKIVYVVLLTAAIISISFVLRAPITSLGPLAEVIHKDVGISNGFIGFLSTLPLIAFSVCSPIISRLSSRFGIFTTMLAGLILIAAGGILRSYTGIPGLVVGTVVLGMGIATGNVLLPSIIKLRFPNHIGIGTSIYITSMAVFASVGAGVSYPLAVGLGLGWKTALVIWSGVAFIAIISWLPQLGLNKETKNTTIKPTAAKANGKNLLRSPLAWHLTLYMGFQSFNFYTITAWLPSIIMDNGMTPEKAGYMALGFQLIGIPASFAVPIFASRIKNQSIIAIGTSGTYFIGLICFLTTEPLPLILISLVSLSFGAAASFSWIMTMVGLRSADAEDAARLSGMSQAIGYLFAAVGPTLCGVLYDLTNSWTFIAVLLSVVTALMTVSGILLTKTK